MSNKPSTLNDGLRAAAAAAAKAKSEAVAQKIRDTMSLIDEEIKAHDGIYPGGRLNQAELCRRAEIHIMTLHAPAHKDSTKRVVETWLESKKEKTLRDTRKAVNERAEHWKEQHHKVATQICIYEAEIAEKNSRIAELEDAVASLREQNALLQKSNVTGLSSVRKERE